MQKSTIEELENRIEALEAQVLRLEPTLVPLFARFSEQVRDIEEKLARCEATIADFKRLLTSIENRKREAFRQAARERGKPKRK